MELDWPVQGFAYEDEQHQSVSQDLAFTLVDFVASDRRYASHFARVPREKWNGSMIAGRRVAGRASARACPTRCPAC